jgi:anti-anti-sigma factor
VALAANAAPVLSPPGFGALVRAEDSAAIVVLRGEADLAAVPALVDTLARVIACFDGPVVVDLAQAEFIDSSTTRVLGRAWQFLKVRGRPLSIRSPTRTAIRLLGFFGLSQLIEPGQTAEL